MRHAPRDRVNSFHVHGETADLPMSCCPEAFVGVARRPKGLPMPLGGAGTAVVGVTLAAKALLCHAQGGQSAPPTRLALNSSYLLAP